MKVREVMTATVVTAAPDSTLREVARTMKQEDIGAIPVVDGDELLGIVTDRDIVVRCIAEGNDPLEATAEEILTGELETIEPDSELDEAAELMSERQIRRLPVVESGRLVGMLSLGDIAVKEHDERKAGGTLAEVCRGVKKSRAAAPARAQAGAQPPARARTTEGRPQARQAMRRKKVVPIRAGAKAAGRKRRKSRRKAS